MNALQSPETTATRLAAVLPRLVQGVSRALGDDFLQSIVVEMSRVIDAEFTFIGRHLAATNEVQTVAMAVEHQPAPNMRYALAGTPCADVVGEQTCMYAEGVAERFPEDLLLGQMGVTGYLGTPLHDSHGAVFGLIVALYRKPIPDAELTRAVFDLFSSRIAAEMERAAREADLAALAADLERRVSERTAELSERNRDLESFAHTVSHDLRAPLRAIEGIAHGIEEDYGPQLPPEPRTQLSRIRRHADHARQIVLDLTHFSLAAVQDRRIAPVDVVPLFLEAVETLRPPTPAVVIEHPEQCIVEADPGMIDVLIQNLVSNAIKYAMKRAEIRVVLGSRPGCSFYVRDNGCGFPQARAAEIFQPFHRLPEHTDVEGTGIGLATVARIVARHEGRVWAEGEPEWGATVYVALPPAA